MTATGIKIEYKKIHNIKIESGRNTLKISIKSEEVFTRCSRLHFNKHDSSIFQISQTCRYYEKTLEKTKPSNDILFVRYEDISLEPLKMASKIYKFIGHELPDELRSWIVSSQNVTRKTAPEKPSKYEPGRNPYSTVRNSTYTMMKWRLQNKFSEVQGVQKMCQNTLRLAGYKLITSEKDLVNLDVPVLDNFSFA